MPTQGHEDLSGHAGLAPSDFLLCWPMKDGLRGQYFPDNDAVMAGVQHAYIANGGDYVEPYCVVVSEALLLERTEYMSCG
jgi:hypothetical protein